MLPHRLGLAASSTLCCLIGGGLQGQSSEQESFVSAALEGVSRFSDVSVAIAEGYRKLGPDFPGMGEHWINPTLVIEGVLDPSSPPVLSYTQIGGERELVGFAFTRVLAPGESPPEGPFPAPAWHDHSGGVDEESVLLSGPASTHGTKDGFRLSMVHVWAPLENPDGLLSQNNWALPFLRVGLPVPDRPTISSARALSTHGEGVAFYHALLEEGLGLGGSDLEIASSAFAEAGSKVEAWLARREGHPLGAESLAELEGVWTGLWVRLRRELPPSVFREIRILDLG